MFPYIAIFLLTLLYVYIRHLAITYDQMRAYIDRWEEEAEVVNKRFFLALEHEDNEGMRAATEEYALINDKYIKWFNSRQI